MDTNVLDCSNAVAIIGMSGRFPGARNLDEFWSNLKQGVESVRFFSDEELIAAGIPPELVHSPDYVKAAPVLEDIDLFDAKLFGIAPREAMVTDPEHRLFLMCAWEAMEQAGYCGETYEGAVGVFAGSGPSMSGYLASETHVNPSLFSLSGSREHIGTDKDYLCTRVSYKLNLRGPSINVQTACSTSLVAVHLACQSLLMGESDMALAGGVTIRVPQVKGHQTRESAMSSHDGHCRTFDAEATGTVFGSGVGVLVLKRLSAAIADGDAIQAVIRGSAVNNDGAAKISFWASSAEGQVPAIAEALAVAEVSAESITMVEAHGTATTLGDPVEIQALTRAFRNGSDKKQYCAIGSVKTNVGHLDSASGIAGLIKAILAVKHRAIPASLNFRTPNPRIDFAKTPFFVNTELRPWEPNGLPRRAAVNSLGIGGTNAFMVLEERPVLTEEREPARFDACLLPLTAKSAKALRELAQRYLHHFRQHPDQNLADAAFTAATGRAMFSHRLAIVANSVTEVSEKLEQFLAGSAGDEVLHGEVPRHGAPKVAMIFSDPPSESLNGYLPLYETDARFRRSLDQWGKRVLALTGKLLIPTLFPAGQEGVGPSRCTSAAMAAMAVQASLAGCAKEWGIVPVATAGSGSGTTAARVASGECQMDDAIQHVQQTSANGSTENQRLPEDVSSDVLWEIGWPSRAASLESPPSSAKLQLPGLARDTCPVRHVLAQVARLFVLGARVDWTAFHAGSPSRRRVVLPTYPFQLKRFWVEPVSASISGNYASSDARVGEETHPILGRRIYSALNPNQHTYESVIDAANPLLSGEGQDNGTRIATRSTYCELARLAIEDAIGALLADFTEFVRHEPLVLRDRESRLLQLTLVEEPSSPLRLEIHSRARGQSAEAGPDWQHHITAVPQLSSTR